MTSSDPPQHGFATDTRLQRELSRAAPEGPSASEMEALYRELSGRMRQERGLAAYLRSRSTRARTAIAWLAIGGIAAVVGLSFARPDLALYPPARMVLTLGAIALVLAVNLPLSLRPLQRPPLPRWVTGLSVGGGLALLLSVYALPAAHAAHPASVHAQELTPMLLQAGRCFASGAVLGLPVYVLLALLDRGGSPHGLATALSAGLAANFLLQLHCPVTAPAHMVVGHLALAGAFVLGCVLYRQRARARD